MRKTLSIILSAIILASTYTQTTSFALEKLIINSSLNNIEYYDSNAACSTGSSTDLSSVSPGSGAPNGLTYPNLDAAKMADAIEKYIEAHAPESPLKGTGQKAVASAKKANLNPFLAYAHAFMESTLATTDEPGAQIKVHQGHNAFGRTATDSQPHVVEASRNWYMWTSFEASVDADADENKNVDSGDWFSYDRAVFSDEIDQGIAAYVAKYAPNGDGKNDEQYYIGIIQDALDEMAGYAGASVATASTLPTASSSTSTTNCCATPTKGGGVVKMLSDNPETALGYLMSAGNGTKLTLAQAAGVVGNLQVESSPNVDPRASNGTHIGIAQWDDNRWNNGVVKFAADMNGDPYDLAIQLRYLAWEMGLTDEWKDHPSTNGGVADAVRATSTPEEAAVVFEATFERSGGSALSQRQSNAKALYDKYKDSSSLSSSGAALPGTSASCSSGSGGTSALQNYTLKYAWKELKHNPRKERTPDYTNAISTAVNEGRYVGEEGIDCGGFVTTLLYDSGFDKTYNKDAKGGPTYEQEAWAKANWQRLGAANGTYEPDGSKFTEDKLQPGDVAFSLGHTWIYVGEINGFESKYASASQGIKAPSAGEEGFFYDQNVWYRKKSSTTSSSGISA
ncbi:MAG: phage tail tip lysozyme [Candidatus Saccharimonas sp.]